MGINTKENDTIQPCDYENIWQCTGVDLVAASRLVRRPLRQLLAQFTSA